jgi:hypothetical protein
MTNSDGLDVMLAVTGLRQKMIPNLKIMKFQPFQIRWRERLKHQGKEYLHRWTFVCFGFSLRVHHWIGSDVGPHLHDHPFNFISILLKGQYINITPNARRELEAPAIWYANGVAKHRLEIPEGGAWTILLCGRPYRKWGFYVNNHKWRPLRYFSKFKHLANN